MRIKLLSSTALRSPDFGGNGSGFQPLHNPGTGRFSGATPPSNKKETPNDGENGDTGEEAKDFWSTHEDFWSKPEVKVEPGAEEAARKAKEASANAFQEYVKKQNFTPEIDQKVFAEAVQTGDPTKLVESLTLSNQQLFSKVLTDVGVMVNDSMAKMRQEMTTASRETVNQRESEASLVSHIPSLQDKPAAKQLAIGLKRQFLSKGSMTDAQANEAVREMLQETGKLADNNTNPGPNTPPNGARGSRGDSGNMDDWAKILSGQSS